MKESTRAALSVAGYTRDDDSHRQMSDTSQSYRWNNADGSFYTVTELIEWKSDRPVVGAVKSWVYRGLGGNAKGQWYPYMKCNPDLNDNDQTLAQHAKRNRKNTPKTKVYRRTSEQVRSDNFVMYD